MIFEGEFTSTVDVPVFHRVQTIGHVLNVITGNSWGAAQASALRLTPYREPVIRKEFPVQSFNPRERQLARLRASIRGGK